MSQLSPNRCIHKKTGKVRLRHEYSHGLCKRCGDKVDRAKAVLNANNKAPRIRGVLPYLDAEMFRQRNGGS